MQPHVPINRDYWNGQAAAYAEPGERLWAQAEPEWGIWSTPEAEVDMLPAEMDGLDAIELGCGTAYVAGWMARRGARVTGIDVSPAQLATARRLADAHGAELTLIEGDAEAVPLPDASFDFAISEYGAAIWCRPEAWLAEAHRLLRPGGRCRFLGNHPLLILATPASGAPAEAVLHRPLRGLTGADWTKVEFEPAGIEFNLPVGAWFALFRRLGFAVEDYRELYARPETRNAPFHVSADWARSWPSEQVWMLRKP